MMHKKFLKNLVVLILISIGFAQLSVGQERLFVDNTGKFQIRGTLLRIDGDSVLIENDKGQTIKIPFERLSIKDQEFLTRKEKPATGDKTKENISDADRQLAVSAKDILNRTCYRCHGEGGSNEGGFNFVLHRDRMVDGDHYILPGDAASSYLFERVESGEMPEPGEAPRPTAEEIETLRKWIDAGAPEFDTKRTISIIFPDEVEREIKKDLETFNERDRKFQRYFTLVHLYNAGVSPDELVTYRQAFAKLVNSLSWNPEVVVPDSINDSETILRIDIRKVNWNREIWNTVVDHYPYGYVTDDAYFGWFLENTGTKLPFVRVDWFVAVASRPPLYHHILQIPETDLELESLLRVNVQNNIAQDKIARAGFNRSGVSHHNRMIERHKTPYGSYWKSYDFGGSAGRQNLFDCPLGPGTDENNFRHDGCEMVFTLPNGFQGYMLTDNRGSRLNVGPTQIVADPGRPDKTVVNGVSCMSCHYGGMVKKQDEIRPHVIANRRSFPDADDILAQYVSPTQLDIYFDEDAARFADAMRKIGIVRLTRSGEPVSNMARRFETELDLQLACAELGVTEEQFQRHLDKSPKLARVLGQLNIPGGSMKRDAFVQIFITAVDEFKLGITIVPNGTDLSITISPAASSRPSSTVPPELALTVAQLKSGESVAVIRALMQLRQKKPAQPNQAVINELRSIVENNQRQFVYLAFPLLAEMDPDGSFDLIAAGLEEPATANAAFTALEKMKDERAAKAIGAQLIGIQSHRALRSLVKIGQPAEKILIRFLPQAGDWTKSKGIVEAMGKIGTSASLPALRKAARSREPFIPDAAATAIRQIKARESQED